MPTTNESDPGSGSSVAPMVGQNVMGFFRFLGALTLFLGLLSLGIWLYGRFSASAPPKDLAMYLIVGITLLVIGPPQLFLVWNLTVDRASRRVTRRLGTMGLVKTTVYPFETFAHISVRRLWIKGQYRYQVFLVGNPTGTKVQSFMFSQYDEHAPALALGEELASYAGFPLEDTSERR
jgi:hypothetical protein